MLQDLAQKESEDVDLPAIDQDACTNLSIGIVVKVVINLSLRESCNKIVHATEARMCWASTSLSKGASEYWNGKYALWGDNRGNKWEVELDIEAWCISMIRFLKLIQEKVDWYHVFKHDE
jgi:hypothetical protein